MSNQNKVLDTFNSPLPANIFSQTNPDATPTAQTTIEGVPLGTADNSSTGELAAKVIVVADRSNSSPGIAANYTFIPLAGGGTATGTIPTTAIRWSVAFSTGTTTTSTIQYGAATAAVIVPNYTFADNATPGAVITCTCTGTDTALIAYVS